MGYNLDRFKQAQTDAYGGYATALQEIKDGYKASHWIWYVFPQLKGLGRSYNSAFYGLAGLDEARAYYADAELRQRLDEITTVLLTHREKDINSVMGGIDALKLKSCMTLFDIVAPNSIFSDVLQAFYNSARDRRTVKMCGLG